MIDGGPDYIEDIKNSNKEVIVFTHNDLDALGSMLNIEFALPNIKKKYWYTNYSNIPQIVKEIESYCAVHNVEHILIPDVSFSDNKEHLKHLYDIAKITHIDHHMYPENFWDEFPNMRVMWDKSKCATLICNEYLGNTGQSSNLDKLSKIIDIYDIWQDQHPAFDVAQSVNDYFWNAHGDIEWLMNEIVKSNYDLPADFNSVISALYIQKDKEIAEYEEKKLIQRAGDITFLFGNAWYNHILINEHRSGKMFFICINDYGIVRVRINQKAPVTLEQLRELRKVVAGNPDIGHSHAFTYKYAGAPSWDNTLKEAQKLSQAIQTVCN